MIFEPLPFAGCFRLVPENDRDRRGYFTRSYARRALEARDLDPAIVHCHVAIHHQRGTRCAPVHRDYPPGEAVLARCTRGAVEAITVDLRPTSATYQQAATVTLEHRARHSVYLAPGVAFGFQTLDEETEVLVQHSELDDPEIMHTVPAKHPAVRAAWPPIPERSS